MNLFLRWICLGLILGTAGCATVPYGVPFFGKPYFPYLENPKFSFEYPLRWGDGKRIPGGVEFQEPHGRVSFAIVYWPQGDPSYKPPDEYRKLMFDWGAVEDAHIVAQVSISSRTAYQVRFTTYKYSPQYVLGAMAPEVSYTERIMVPDPDGIYLITYGGEKKYFWKKSYRKSYAYFLKTLTLAEPKKRRAPVPTFGQ